jgi:hypothetical protein
MWNHDEIPILIWKPTQPMLPKKRDVPALPVGLKGKVQLDEELEIDIDGRRDEVIIFTRKDSENMGSER